VPTARSEPEPVAPESEPAGLVARLAAMARGSGRKSRWRSVVGWTLGALLFAGAIVALVAGGQNDLALAVDAVASAPRWLIAAALLLPVANWLCVSAAFAILTRRYTPEGTAPVGYGEMTALIGSAWLLNHLPMRPGLVGRVAYHKTVNGIRFADSARILIESMLLTGIAVITLFAVALIMIAETSALAMSLTYAAPAVVIALAWLVLGLARSPLARHAGALFFKFCDMSIWVARYAVVFALVGAPLDAPRTVLVAAISQIVLLIPISGNGIGLREWAVAFTAEAGLRADVVNRAAETIMVLPIGLVCTWWVARRYRRHRQIGASNPRPGPANAPPAEVVDPPPDQADTSTRTVRETTDPGGQP
jgi:hypothetical protein